MGRMTKWPLITNAMLTNFSIVTDPMRLPVGSITIQCFDSIVGVRDGCLDMILKADTKVQSFVYPPTAEKFTGACPVRAGTRRLKS